MVLAPSMHFLLHIFRLKWPKNANGKYFRAEKAICLYNILWLENCCCRNLVRKKVDKIKKFSVQLYHNCCYEVVSFAKNLNTAGRGWQEQETSTQSLLISHSGRKFEFPLHWYLLSLIFLLSDWRGLSNSPIID